MADSRGAPRDRKFASPIPLHFLYEPNTSQPQIFHRFLRIVTVFELDHADSIRNGVENTKLPSLPDFQTNAGAEVDAADLSQLDQLFLKKTRLALAESVLH